MAISEITMCKSFVDTINYLYEHTGNRIRKTRTSTNEVVYNINGVYEVTKIPNMSDRHTLHIRGIKDELVAQYTASDVVLLTENAFSVPNKASIIGLISNLKNTLDQNRIRFAKWVTRTQANNPFALKIYSIYAILFCILLYAITSRVSLPLVTAKSTTVSSSVVENYKNKQSFSQVVLDPARTDNVVPIDSSRTGLRTVSLLLIVSISFAFSNCAPHALTGGNRPPTPPYWLFAAFANEPDSQSVSTGGGNNPAAPSSGFGGSGTLSSGTPRLGMYFFHPDHAGSISMITDGSGRMMTDTSGASRLTYKPYGEVNRMNSYGPDIFRYKYTSQQDDQDIGLYYYNARYYDPVIGLFTSADSVTSATSSFGLNHYMYTEGNPVRYGDANGHFIGPLLYAGFQFVVGAVAAIAIGTTAVIAGAAIAAGMAAATAITAVATATQTALIATASFVASVATSAIKFAMMVNPFGTVGAGIGFLSEGIRTGTLKGALAGAEIGFKIGTVIWAAAATIYVGWYLGGPALEALPHAAGFIEVVGMSLTLGIAGALFVGGIGFLIGYIAGGTSNGAWDEKEANYRANEYGSIGARGGFAVGFGFGMAYGGYLNPSVISPKLAFLKWGGTQLASIYFTTKIISIKQLQLDIHNGPEADFKGNHSVNYSDYFPGTETSDRNLARNLSIIIWLLNAR